MKDDTARIHFTWGGVYAGDNVLTQIYLSVFKI
jgi:hypothetical protein